mmetsp:Transcript_8853/g.12601  ORF Transcript_8853/g.12601 Transcript_8853/m.12601 type:complete len:278 (-) Transcript_8853:297-1130(-)
MHEQMYLFFLAVIHAFLPVGRAVTREAYTSFALSAYRSNQVKNTQFKPSLVKVPFTYSSSRCIGKYGHLQMVNDNRCEESDHRTASTDTPEDTSMDAISYSDNNKKKLFKFRSSFNSKSWKSLFEGLPPFQLEDTTLLFYDVFLLMNLSASISFWVVHRLSIFYIASAVSEGALVCLLWILAGLFNGAFLFSARDGHYDMACEEQAESGGPKAAGLLGLSTFISTVNLRLLVAFGTAVFLHRPVGTGHGEELIPLEVVFGLVLMSMWRMLHSLYAFK